MGDVILFIYSDITNTAQQVENEGVCIFYEATLRN